MSDVIRLNIGKSSTGSSPRNPSLMDNVLYLDTFRTRPTYTKLTTLGRGEIYTHSSHDDMIVRFKLNWIHHQEFKGLLETRYSNKDIQITTIGDDCWVLIPKTDFLFPSALLACLQGVIALEWTLRYIDVQKYVRLWSKIISLS